jgi:hypothetical protein
VSLIIRQFYKMAKSKCSEVFQKWESGWKPRYGGGVLFHNHSPNCQNSTGPYLNVAISSNCPILTIITTYIMSASKKSQINSTFSIFRHVDILARYNMLFDIETELRIENNLLLIKIMPLNACINRSRNSKDQFYDEYFRKFS